MTAVVQRARAWADGLVGAEARGPGDYLPAMTRVARRLGVSENTLRRLRYRPPKDVPASLFEKLRLAHEAELLRQERKLTHELALARAAGRASSPLVRAAAVVAGCEDCSEDSSGVSEGMI